MADPKYIMEHCAAMRSRTVARHITRLYDEALRPEGITLGQFTLLVAIQMARPTAISRFAETLGMDRSTLTRNLKLLEKMGLVRLGPEQARRARDMQLTTAGEAKLAAAYPHWEEAQRTLQQRLGAETWDHAFATFNTLMQRL